MTQTLVRAIAAALLSAPLALGLSMAARADGSIQITDVFARAAPAGGVGGLYLTIVNNGSADRLTGVVAAVAGKAELHENIDDKGVMKMRPLAALDIPAGATIKLSPGGYHVMLVGLKQAVIVGGHIPVTLTFEKAGIFKVEANVVKPGAGAPGSHDMRAPMGQGMGQGMAPGMGSGMGNMPGMMPAK